MKKYLEWGVWILAVILVGLLFKNAVAASSCTGQWIEADRVYMVTWANVNTTGASAECSLPYPMDRGYAKYARTGTGVTNVTIQMGDRLPLTISQFTNATTTNAITASNTDTLKQDFVYRGGTRTRLWCESGCSLTNTISSAVGVFWRVGQ